MNVCLDNLNYSDYFCTWKNISTLFRYFGPAFGDSYDGDNSNDYDPGYQGEVIEDSAQNDDIPNFIPNASPPCKPVSPPPFNT